MDTIVAQATPVGIGALGIVRLSGDEAFRISASFFRSTPSIIDAAPWQALYGRIIETNLPLLPSCPQLTLDWAVAIKYAAPKSYTGEDSVEIISHGSVLILKEIVSLALASGAREALPGEFTQRAYLNGKMDLTQAEALGAMIRASSQRGRRLEARIVSGQLSAKIKALSHRLVEILGAVEVIIDHPDEPDVTESIEPKILSQNLRDISGEIHKLTQGFSATQKIREGFKVAIVGAPNAGKSTLLNSLLLQERAIVSSEPATTRDTVEETVSMDGCAIRLVDTAGWRTPRSSVEAMGLERTQDALDEADLLFWVIDATQKPKSGEAAQKFLKSIRNQSKPTFILLNKKDLPDFDEQTNIGSDCNIQGKLSLSAKNQDGVDQLKKLFARYLESLAPSEEDLTVVEERQLNLLRRCNQNLEGALKHLESGSWELSSFELRHAGEKLRMILGEGQLSEHLLRSIFSKFCIGK